MYAATKAYVLSFTEGLQVEYANDDIRILALCPGPTYTDFFHKTGSTPDDIKAKFRPPKDVVDEALSDIKDNRGLVVVGWENKLMTSLMKFLPRSIAAKLLGSMVKNGENKP